MNGENIHFYENGTILLYIYWQNGVPEGREYNNYENGKLAHEKFYLNNFKSGTWKFYDENEIIITEQIYIENKTPWDSQLNYMTEKNYSNNKLAFTVTYEAGKVTSTTIIDKKEYQYLKSKEPPLGQKLFEQDCAMCHSINEDVVGPKLKGVTDRRTNSWLKQMITNGVLLKNNGDVAANKLYKTWQNMEHPNFEYFTKEELDAVIDYLEMNK